MRFLIGIIAMAGGFLVTWKSEWLFRNFGTIPFFEKYLHSSGGGRLGYKLIGILFIFVGILAITNLHVQLLEGIAGFFTFGAGGQ
jgi:hypothetical protein